jgi:hypothetical protein
LYYQEKYLKISPVAAKKRKGRPRLPRSKNNTVNAVRAFWRQRAQERYRAKKNIDGN